MGFLPKGVKIVGYARTKMDDVEYHKRITSYIKDANDDEAKAQLEEFKQLSTYVSGGYEDGESFDKLHKYLEDIESGFQSNEHNRLFYLALPPSVFIPVAKNLKEHVYSKSGINRIIVEKPFGKDLDSCRELLSSLKQHWTEDETFRIDHYLGKEMVKNLLVLRFANVAMGAAWDKNSISNVQITFKEPFGTEGRGGYFDEFGIIRDILQNRTSPSWYFTRSLIWFPDLLQVLSILTMERPVSFAAEDIRDEKVCDKFYRLIKCWFLTQFTPVTNRSRFYVRSHLLNAKTRCLVSMSEQMESPAISTMTRSHLNPSAPLTLPLPSGSTTLVGKACLSSSRQAKVNSRSALLVCLGNS